MEIRRRDTCTPDDEVRVHVVLAPLRTKRTITTFELALPPQLLWSRCNRTAKVAPRGMSSDSGMRLLDLCLVA